MDMSAYIQMMAALLFVLALMGLLWLGLRRIGLTTPAHNPNTPRRLRVIETLALSTQHRAVLIERDDVQHLVIIGPNGETIVETGIKKDE
jgi:flagellar protein FliO/FliZ